MQVTKLYIFFLWIMTMSLFSTMLYMSRLCMRDITNRRVMDLYRPNKTSNTRASVPAREELQQDYVGADIPITLPKTKELHKNTDKLPACQVSTKDLRGWMNISSNITVKDVRNLTALSRVKYGGVYVPNDCKPTEKVAVIIPYRDREQHLEILVHHLHSMLQRQKLHYGIYVVEMAFPVQFNRGLLANVGFLTARSIGNYSCYIIHDVDLLPVNDWNIYKCSNTTKRLLSVSEKFKTGTPPYNSYVGGVLAIPAEQFLQVNGFSNLYFGWGGEDDDLYRRLDSVRLTVHHSPEEYGVYSALQHVTDMSNPPNPYRDSLVKQAAIRMKLDGLSTIQYQRKALEFRQLYTWILVKCVESEIMENWPHLRVNTAFIYKRPKEITQSDSNEQKALKVQRFHRHQQGIQKAQRPSGTRHKIHKIQRKNILNVQRPSQRKI